MKHRWGMAFVAACWVLVFTGCQQQPKTLDLNGGMLCDVSIQYGDVSAQGRLERTAAGVCRLTVSQPSELSGMVFDWDGSDLQLSFKGLSYTLDSTALPKTAFASVLLRCLDAAASQGALAVKNQVGDLLICSGQGEDGAFTLEYNSASGQIESLTIPAMHFEATFSSPVSSES